MKHSALFPVLLIALLVSLTIGQIVQATDYTGTLQTNVLTDISPRITEIDGITGIEHSAILPVPEMANSYTVSAWATNGTRSSGGWTIYALGPDGSTYTDVSALGSNCTAAADSPTFVQMLFTGFSTTAFKITPAGSTNSTWDARAVTR